MKKMSDMSDLEFNDIIVLEVIPYLNTNSVRLKVPAGGLASAIALAALWTPNWMLHISPATNSEESNKKKDIYRSQIKKVLSAIFADIPKSVITSTDELSLPVKGKRAAGEESQAVDFSPQMTKKSKGEGHYEIHLRNPNTPASRKFPKGQKTIVLLEIITEQGVTPSLDGPYRKVYHTNKSLKRLYYSSEHFGKQVNLLAYYLSSRGEDGAVSASFFSFVVGS